MHFQNAIGHSQQNNISSNQVDIPNTQNEGKWKSNFWQRMNGESFVGRGGYFLFIAGSYDCFIIIRRL